MTKGLRILHLEEEMEDAGLVRVMLAEEGIDCDIVQATTRNEFAAALDQNRFDLILAEYALSEFDGMTALLMAREKSPHFPFIFVTGTMGEEIAINSLKMGATDYVLKNRLSRLAPAVRRALKEVEEYRSRCDVERALSQSNETLQSLIHVIPLAVVIIDSSARVLIWNPAAVRLFGWNEEEVLGKRIPMIPEQQREEFEAVLREEMAGITYRNKEVQRLRKDGSLVEVSLWTAPFRGQGDSIRGVIGMFADITGQKELARQLERSEQMFRAAFENAAIGMCLTNMDGRLLAANNSLCSMLLQEKEKLISRQIVALNHPEDMTQTLTVFENLKSGAASSHCQEFRFLREDGQIVWGLVSIVLLRDEEDTPLLFIIQIQDVTARKNLENQLLHAQKMEAIGTLTEGIAHDFNNIFTAIMGNASILAMRLAQDNDLSPLVQRVLVAADRAAGLTHSLLSFGRKKSAEPVPLNVAALLMGMKNLLAKLLREDIELRIAVNEEFQTVLAVPGQLEQAVVNLATNSRQAMPHGGCLTISTARAEIDDKFVKIHGFGTPGKYCLITLTDNGAGMSEETRKRIFEPFFTTKIVGQGSGLGLSIVYGIIKQHNGYITCTSKQGAGTSFMIYLPEFESMVGGQRVSTPVIAPGGNETILFADDDEQVREFCKELLQTFGYRIIEAKNGEEAIAQFEEHGDEISIAILDAVMPTKSGKDAYDRMNEIRPGLKAIFTSGYSDEICRQKGIVSRELRLISKPIPFIELLKTIREILDN